MNYLCLLFFLAVLSFSACDITPHPDTIKALEELKKRKPRIVKEGELMSYARQCGKSAIEQLESQLSRMPKQDSLSISTINNTLTEWIAASDSLYPGRPVVYLVDGKEVDFQHAIEKKVFEAYLFDAEKSNTNTLNIQSDDNGETIIINLPYYYYEELKGMWSVHYQRKNLILSMPEPKK